MLLVIAAIPILGGIVDFELHRCAQLLEGPQMHHDLVWRAGLPTRHCIGLLLIHMVQQFFHKVAQQNGFPGI